MNDTRNRHESGITWQRKAIQHKLQHKRSLDDLIRFTVVLDYVTVHLPLPASTPCCSVLWCSGHQSCNAGLGPAGRAQAQRVEPPSNKHPVGGMVCQAVSGLQLVQWWTSVTTEASLFHFPPSCSSSAPPHPWRHGSQPNQSPSDGGGGEDDWMHRPLGGFTQAPRSPHNARGQ